ncbi:NADPH-dependent FMN reductase [Dyadobacter soli]|uniref:NADPH-dependent FMN reductase n=1 Tax=Dyadobacter soli TaxID=659014 RepID=A0A1G7MPR9_9BACT|nr:NAD(P)H-dependent oxidoreductase [Dyadobacter soli]SDF63099.1 NADPH-dependent FMN reductase [Dyadobacter soli]
MLDKLVASEVIIFATPIWWGNHCSQIQQIIERLDHIHDDILAGKGSVLDGKTDGILITGDSDGTQHITGSITNFFGAIGIKTPPYTSLSVISDKHQKQERPSKQELMDEYEKQYSDTAEKMAKQLIGSARAG